MTTTTILTGYSMDYTFQIHYAQRADGQWFKRIQDRHPRFGYRWTAWRAACEPDLSRFRPSTLKARLPKGA